MQEVKSALVPPPVGSKVIIPRIFITSFKYRTLISSGLRLFMQFSRLSEISSSANNWRHTDPEVSGSARSHHHSSYSSVDLTQTRDFFKQIICFFSKCLFKKRRKCFLLLFPQSSTPVLVISSGSSLSLHNSLFINLEIVNMFICFYLCLMLKSIRLGLVVLVYEYIYVLHPMECFEMMTSYRSKFNKHSITFVQCVWCGICPSQTT